MKDFIVNVRETWVQPVKVQAQTKKEALEKVVEGEGEYLEESLEYSHTNDTDTWDVKEDNK